MCLLIQALDMHLQMPFILGCMNKNLRALEFCSIGCNILSWFLNHYPNLAFTLYTLNILYTRLGMGTITDPLFPFNISCSSSYTVGTGARVICGYWLMLKV